MSQLNLKNMLVAAATGTAAFVAMPEAKLVDVAPVATTQTADYTGVQIQPATKTVQFQFGSTAVAQDRGGLPPSGDVPRGCGSSCGGTPKVPHGHQDVIQKVKNNFLALGLGAAAAAVNGCVAIEGVGIGGGFNGFGAMVNFSKTNQTFFVICKTFEQLDTIMAHGTCPMKRIAMTAMAMGDPQNGIPANGPLQRAMGTIQGQRDYKNACQPVRGLKWGG